MPIYEYQCQSCGRTLEKRQKFSDAPLTECPHCGGSLEKLISAPAVQFKGGGWYADGYGNKTPSKSSDSNPSSTPAATPSTAPAASSTPAASTPAPSAPASTTKS